MGAASSLVASPTYEVNDTRSSPSRERRKGYRENVDMLLHTGMRAFGLNISLFRVHHHPLITITPLPCVVGAINPIGVLDAEQHCRRISQSDPERVGQRRHAAAHQGQSGQGTPLLYGCMGAGVALASCATRGGVEKSHYHVSVRRIAKMYQVLVFFVYIFFSDSCVVRIFSYTYSYILYVLPEFWYEYV